MMRIRRQDLTTAAEALMIAARNATNAEGLRIFVDLPMKPPAHSGGGIVAIQDNKRIEAIALGALTALCNGTVVPDDTVPIRMTADSFEVAA